MLTSKFIDRIACVICCLFCSASLFAAPDVTYDHYGTNKDESHFLEVLDDEGFVVRVKNTCPKAFSYEIKKFLQKPTGTPPPRLIAAAKPVNCFPGGVQDLIDEDPGVCIADQEQQLPALHEDKFGGYLVQIRKAKGDVTALDAEGRKEIESLYQSEFKNPGKVLPSVCKASRKTAFDTALTKVKSKAVLKDVDILIAVENRGWDYEIAGAFTISDIVDPKYALRPDPNDMSMMPQNLLIQDGDAEDDQNLGFAGFIHMTHPKWENWAPLSFGLGIADESDVSFYLGTSWRLGGKAYLTGGLQWAKVDTLPAGEMLGTAPSSDNVLSNLGSRTENGFFLSLSYSFLKPGDNVFRKPFAVPGDGE